MKGQMNEYTASVREDKKVITIYKDQKEFYLVSVRHLFDLLQQEEQEQ